MVKGISSSSNIGENTLSLLAFWVLKLSAIALPIGSILLFIFNFTMQESHFLGFLLIHQEIDHFALIA